jgi:RNA polymerase sigma factor (sigma-70 family)
MEKPNPLNAGVLMRPIADLTRPSRARSHGRRMGPDRRRDRRSMARPLTATGQARVAAFTTLAYRLAWYFARSRATDVPVDELIAEAFYGLTYAAGMFRPSKRVPFGAYATMVIRHRLMQAIRAWRRDRWAGPFPTGTDEYAWEAPDPKPAPDLAARAAAREMCERVRRALPARLYTILRLYHGEGRTLEEIGTTYGVTRQRIRQLLAKATARARRHFPEWAAAGTTPSTTPSPQ